jgi:predicted DNA-binding transcriptional regulator YafY
MINEYFNAVDKQIKMDITYCKESGETTRRVIHPYFILIGDNSSYLIAYCEKRDEIRTFKISRILTHSTKDNESFSKTMSFEQYRENIILIGKFTVFDGNSESDHYFSKKSVSTIDAKKYDGDKANLKSSSATKKTGCLVSFLIFAVIILIIVL